MTSRQESEAVPATKQSQFHAMKGFVHWSASTGTAKRCNEKAQ
jgi:hypothetical protein